MCSDPHKGYARTNSAEANVHIQGRLITGLYSNNVGYVLAQVVSLVFRKQSARSKLLEYTILEEANFWIPTVKWYWLSYSKLVVNNALISKLSQTLWIGTGGDLNKLK